MDNIKFRAWQKYHKKMVEVTGIDFDRIGEIEAISTFVENQAPQDITYRNGLGRFFLSDERGPALELMQFTGLKDKNGVEIYEGDIYEDGDSKRHVVTFKNGGFGRVGRFLINYHTNESIVTHEPLINDVIDGCEVIGNIYENPSLLEEST